MKKLLLLAIICMGSIAGYGQAQSITIVNNSPCDVYYVLYGDILSNCVPTHRSLGMTILSGGVVTYTDPTDPGIAGGMDDGWGNFLSPTDVFTRVRVYQGNPMIACMPTPMVHVNVGGCGSVPTFASIFLWQYNAGRCSQCTAISRSVTWVATTPSTATITIN